MKRELANFEIENILTILNGKDSFMLKVKLPPQVRYALRVNRQVLLDRMKIYQEERANIVKSYIENGHAHQVGDEVQFDEAYKNVCVHEIQELSVVKNELEFQKIDKEVLEDFLNSQELTMAEEDVLLLFKE